ncbi:hypothetical protein VR44_11590 [Streptomyces katrae]|uniref:Uncharacterized protein n=1 Tax=Streptomyces katrae TaxID=68223 RepID=A0A0F4JLD8_9ACTN|nr:hypothetical protein VR44_11590 [Streptomyces katrae]
MGVRSDRDGPEPGPRPGHVYVESVGGPLAGELVDVCGWEPREIVDQAMLMWDHGRFGPASRPEEDLRHRLAAAG